jgi:serine/threonine protein kinase
MSHLHTLRTPFLHGDFKPSDVLVTAKTLQPKITNFGLWDFKNFFVENAQPDHDHLALLNSSQAPEVLVGGERPTLFSDIWSLSSTLLQWLLETPTWNFQELCSRYKYRDNKQVPKIYVPKNTSPNSAKRVGEQFLEMAQKLVKQGSAAARVCKIYCVYDVTLKRRHCIFYIVFHMFYYYI